jgi:mRNA interferase MazF
MTKGANISRDYKTNVRIAAKESGLPLETVFLCFQIRSLDTKRFADKPVGKLSNELMKKIEKTVRYCLGL